MATKNFIVDGMTCGHCEMSVTEQVAEIPGVTNIDVDHARNHLVVSAGGDVDVAAVLAAVHKAGFSASEA